MIRAISFILIVGLVSLSSGCGKDDPARPPHYAPTPPSMAPVLATTQVACGKKFTCYKAAVYVFETTTLIPDGSYTVNSCTYQVLDGRVTQE